MYLYNGNDTLHMMCHKLVCTAVHSWIVNLHADLSSVAPARFSPCRSLGLMLVPSRAPLLPSPCPPPMLFPHPRCPCPDSLNKQHQLLRATTIILITYKYL